MTDKKITLTLEGVDIKQVKAVAQELADLINEEFDTNVKPLEKPNVSDNGLAHKSIELAIAGAAVILAIPNAVLGAIDLVDRVKKTKKAKKVLDVGKQKVREKVVKKIRITDTNGMTREIEQVTETDFIEDIKQ